MKALPVLWWIAVDARLTPPLSEATRKRVLFRRIGVLQGILLFLVLLIVARLIEIQILRGADYQAVARSQHYGGVVLPAKRGEILSRSSRTGELSVLATNTTLDLVYVDPLAMDDPNRAAEFLAETLLTDDIDRDCRRGSSSCPRELRSYYGLAFDPFTPREDRPLEAAPAPRGVRIAVEALPLIALTRPSSDSVDAPPLPSLEEIRRRWADDIVRRAEEEYVSFVPLLYSATKVQLQQVEDLSIPGVGTNEEAQLVYADPTAIPDHERPRVARILSPILQLDRTLIAERLTRRRLRYVPVLHRLSPAQSDAIRTAVVGSAGAAAEERGTLQRRERYDLASRVRDPLRGIALLPEHWRFYPDGTLASHVVGFLNQTGQAQYGVERTLDVALRGEEGRIQSLTDPFGGRIRSGEERVVEAKDGDTIVLTIDRLLQKRVEDLLARTVEEFRADSGQVIVVDPFTGRIIVMANAPLFDANDYGSVFDLVPLHLPPEREREIVVEIFHPLTRTLVIRAFLPDLAPEGRGRLSPSRQQKLQEVEEVYDLEDIARYYLYIGQNSRREIFPATPDVLAAGTDPKGWLAFRNGIGVGAYLNRAVLEIYEPGSVFKPVTMAIALDQSEVQPLDRYLDKGPVRIDEYTIRNALNTYFGDVTMVQCLQFSINTCMTSVSEKLGKKLFHTAIVRFGFGRLTGVQIEDELPGQVLPWKKWSNALLATAAYGQGISATPLQMTMAFAALANGGRFMKPTVVDRIVHADGTVDVVRPQVVDQVITEQTAATITAMLVAAVQEGYGKRAKILGYNVAGKTGTSQIAGPGGKYETGTGSTIASFAGYAPATDPKFVMLVKIDRPRLRAVVHGAEVAAPLFREIATMLLEYYGVPPEEREGARG